MPWVKFIQRFDFQATPRLVISYRAGCTYLVKQACAALAVDQGKAVLVERPAKTRMIRNAGR